jgi:RsiW-degrading membrane proteinase PrsW (M82 family)
MLLILESLPTVIGTAAVAPALFFLWLVIATGERPGPPLRVWGAFFLGAASISLLGLARAPFAKLVAGTGHPWADQALHSLFAVAAPEEIVKVLVIVVISFVRRRTYAEPMDTIVYGAAAGLGFAAYENLAYLVQHPDIWRALAALRSVLTVPFHGALGIIAGAYLAIARAGTALGAHRHHRDWARFSSYFMVLFAPIALHSAFDFPLLLLQKGGLDPTTRMILGASSVLIGAMSIAFAVRLVWRVGRHHAPRTEVARERFSELRRMWALLVFGGGAGFAGVVFLLGAVRRWLMNPDRNLAVVASSVGLISILIGIALLVATTAVYYLGRNRMRASSDGFTASGQG